MSLLNVALTVDAISISSGAVGEIDSAGRRSGRVGTISLRQRAAKREIPNQIPKLIRPGPVHALAAFVFLDTWGNGSLGSRTGGSCQLAEPPAQHSSMRDQSECRDNLGFVRSVPAAGGVAGGDPVVDAVEQVVHSGPSDRHRQDRPLRPAIGGRYTGADRAEEFGRRNAVPGELLVRLRPQRLIAAADLAG
jgi:hypothetical protein